MYARRVDSSALDFSISSHRHSYVGLSISSLFFLLKKMQNFAGSLFVRPIKSKHNRWLRAGDGTAEILS